MIVLTRRHFDTQRVFASLLTRSMALFETTSAHEKIADRVLLPLYEFLHWVRSEEQDVLDRGNDENVRMVSFVFVFR